MGPQARIAAVTLLFAVLSVAEGAQAEQSEAAATTLTQLMQARGVDSIGARDPAAPDRFVAALNIPGDQLLVVAAGHPTPALLDQRLQEKAYRELYLDLQATPTPKGKLFVMDSRGDGLHASRQAGQPFDIVYEDGTRTTSFDGDWKGQKLSEAAYLDRFATIDAQYAHMLTTLAAVLQDPPFAPPPATR